jgi:NADPH:quinone reductase-like Zn-dependent oxidoreductase
MRAIAVLEDGGRPALTDLPVREAEAGELLVEVHASSVNGFDIAVLSGWVRDFMEYRFPLVPGKDFAGRVAAVGNGVSRFAVGDSVFGVVMTPYVGGDGAFAEYLVVGEQYGVTRVPAGMDLAAAGALGLAGSAALTALDALALKAGQTLLVAGATGGVGSIAVQYAARAGVRVLGTARPGEEADFIHDLGAEQAVDYSGDLTDAVRAVAPDGVDAVLHLAGAPRLQVGLLAPGGCLASTLMFGPEQHPSAVSIIADPAQGTLDRLAADVTAGRLSVPIQRSYPLEDAPQALDDFAGGTRGKLAVSVR